jgi:hypothetical protein
MGEKSQSDDTALVNCEVCLKEIPVSEAEVTEVNDYVAHFCGLDCYQKWRDRADEIKSRSEN